MRRGYFEQACAALAESANDRKRISGWTHNFYSYPARFSPRFASTAIHYFSRPGDIVLDPYMGGGTAVVEGVIAGRHVIGNDLNSLATFITKVKVTPLTQEEVWSLKVWAQEIIPRLSYQESISESTLPADSDKLKNMTLIRARFIKKILTLALASISVLRTQNAQNFAKCVLLRVGQWALDGRRVHTSLSNFRNKLTVTMRQMLESITDFSLHTKHSAGSAKLLNEDASALDKILIDVQHEKATLVVTSPPYPGVHVLYHRWQVDGRRETPAPYWIAGCDDGKGAAYYNFGDRRQVEDDTYFENSLITLRAIRKVLRNGGYMVQMLAFSRTKEQLPRYLENMELSGFKEITIAQDRIWRQVPQRKWHTAIVGNSDSANEVVLVHKAN